MAETNAITQVDEERLLRGATAELARVDAVDGGGVTGEVLGRAGIGTWRRSGGRRARRSRVEPPPGSLGETRQPLAGPARLSLAMGIAWTRREITTTRSGTGGEAAASRGDFAEMSPPDFSENIINQLEAAGSLR